MSSVIEWGALWRVVIVGVVVGAGLPALFALGVRSLAGRGSTRPDGSMSRARMVGGVLAFGTVLAAIAYALWLIASGGH